MDEIRHVRIEYDDKVMWIEGEEALKWQKHTDKERLIILRGTQTGHIGGNNEIQD